MSRHLLEARNLARHFRQRGTHSVLRAVDGLDFTIEEGSTLGVVGESGSGKSTLARLVMALDRPTAGEVIFAGESLFTQPAHRLTRLRRGFQMVFQDPYGSLDPRQTVARIIAEPLHLDPEAPRGAARRARVAEVLSQVGPRRRRCRSPAPPVLRRAAPAHRHRARPHQRPPAGRRR